MHIQYGKPDSVSTDRLKLTLAQFVSRYRPSSAGDKTSPDMMYRVYTRCPLNGSLGSSTVFAASSEEAKAKVNGSGPDVAVRAEVIAG